MNNLLDKMESDVKKPTIGDNSLKEMADLCAEQVALEEEMEQLSEPVSYTHLTLPTILRV